MQFMLLLYADEKAGAAIPSAEMAKAMEGMYAYQAALTKAGAFIVTNPLAQTDEARTVSVDDTGAMKVHNGPYADTQEQLGGYYIIEAPDIDAALKLAGQCPAAQWGHIEVRRIADVSEIIG